MTLLVADASVLGRIILPGQDGTENATELFASLVAAGAEVICPDLLPYEIGLATRRLRTTVEAHAAVIPRVLQLVRLVRPTTDDHAAALEETRRSGLSFYDATYVALARSSHAPLWTEDKEILRKCGDVAMDTASLRVRPTI